MATIPMIPIILFSLLPIVIADPVRILTTEDYFGMISGLMKDATHRFLGGSSSGRYPRSGPSVIHGYVAYQIVVNGLLPINSDDLVRLKKNCLDEEKKRAYPAVCILVRIASSVVMIQKLIVLELKNNGHNYRVVEQSVARSAVGKGLVRPISREGLIQYCESGQLERTLDKVIRNAVSLFDQLTALTTILRSQQNRAASVEHGYSSVRLAVEDETKYNKVELVAYCGDEHYRMLFFEVCDVIVPRP